MAKPGRKLKELDPKIFEGLCSIQCTQQEICDAFDVDHKTLTRWVKRHYGKEFSQVYAEKRSLGKISLRRSMFKMAQKTPSMAIFLSKQYLGMQDKVAVDNHEALERLDNILASVKETADADES